MSLTGQLATGELGRWCAATLTGTGHLAADVGQRTQFPGCGAGTALARERQARAAGSVFPASSCSPSAVEGIVG